jgi:hypothetical protein
MKMKPNHINMTQIIKKCFIPLFITLLVLTGLIISPATVLAQSNCVCAVCGKPCDEISKSGHRPGYSCYVANKPAAGSTPSGGGQDIKMQMIESIFQPFFNSLFAPSDNSEQEQLQQQEKQKQLAEEKAKKDAMQRWQQLQSDEDLKKKMDEAARMKQGEDVLSKMQTVGSGGKLEPFSVGNPKLDLKPISQNMYPTSGYTQWQRLLCSAYFSNMARQSTKDVDARFYADQAQRVMSGEPTYLECKVPQVSNEKMAKRMEEVKKGYDEMNIKIKDLQEIDYKLAETQEKIKDVESKKEKVTVQINELQTRAAAAKPEEKDEMDELLREARKLSQDADQELNQIKQSESEYLNKKVQTENELNKLKSQMQGKIQAGGE